MYFFTPAREPTWAAGILAWVSWEIYGQIRQANEEARQRAVGADLAPVPNANGAAAGAGANGPGAGPGAGAGAAPRLFANRADPMAALWAHGPSNARARAAALALMDRIATYNLDDEDVVLHPLFRPALPQPIRPASTLSRIATFLMLFVATLHPAVWDRRRKRLRDREGKVKEVYGAGRALVGGAERTVVPANGPAENEPVPEETGPAVGERRRDGLEPWVRAYVEGVLNGDILDEGEV